MTRYDEYRSGTIRHDDAAYRRAGWYFVTVCTGDRRPFWGRVQNGILQVSAAGCIAAREWQRTPAVRPYVRLVAGIVMPGHIHGSTNEFRLCAHSFGAIIGRYKSVYTKQIRRDKRSEFEWQSQFYDRIIRDAEAVRTVRQYICATRWIGQFRTAYRPAVGPAGGSTTSVPVAVWPRVSGRYIISASAGGCSNVPAVVARAT